MGDEQKDLLMEDEQQLQQKLAQKEEHLQQFENHL